MAWKGYSIVTVIVVLSILSGIAIGRYINKPIIKIVTETKTINKIIYQPKNCDEYQACFNHPLEIDGMMSGNWLLVACSDGCRDAEKGFKLSSDCAAPKNILSAGLLTVYVDGKIRVLGGGGYSRAIWRSVYIGGDAYSNGTDHAAAVRASLAW